MKSKKWVLWVLGVGMLVCLLPCVFGVVAFKLSPFGQADENMKAERERAKKLGLVTDIRQLQTLIAPVADSDNAYPLYLKAKDSFTGSTQDSKVISEALQGAATVDWTNLNSTLAKLAQSVNAAREVAAKTGFDAKRPWEKNFEILYPEFAKMKGAARVLGASALLKAHQGRRPEAIEDLIPISNLARQASQDPSLIATLVKEAVESIQWGALQQILKSGPLTQADRVALSKLSSKLVPPPDFDRAMNESLLSYDQAISDGKFVEFAKGSGNRTLDRTLKYKVLREPNRVQIWRIHLDLIEARRKPGQTVREQASAVLQVTNTYSHTKGVEYLLVRYFQIDEIDSVLLSIQKAVVRKEILAALGSGTESSLASKPDPLAAKGNYRVVKKDGVMTFYSVGIDGKDDGGILRRAQTSAGKPQGLDYGIAIQTR